MQLNSLLFNLGLFGISSVTSCLVDNVLFWLLFDYALGAGHSGRLFWSVALARLVSLTYNFLINKIIVFRFRPVAQSGLASTGVAALKYLVLAACIMLASYSLTKFFDWLFKIQRVICVKILVDASLFICSYLAQKHFVFRLKRRFPNEGEGI